MKSGSLRVCGNRSLSIIVVTLFRGERSIRESYVNDVLRVLPSATVLRALDGHDPQVVAEALRQDSVPYHKICRTQGEWGALACFASRHRAFAAQTSDYQVLLEDDIRLLPRFLQVMMLLIGAHYCGSSSRAKVGQQVCSTNGVRHPCFQRGRPPPDLVQLGSYGEGYITSRAGAHRLARKVRHVGIVGCGDQQYNVGSILNISHAWSRRPLPWRLLEPTNSGARAATGVITRGQADALRRCTAATAAGQPHAAPCDDMQAIAEAEDAARRAPARRRRGAAAGGASQQSASGPSWPVLAVALVVSIPLLTWLADRATETMRHVATVCMLRAGVAREDELLA